MSAPDRRARLDMRHKKLSVRRQCALLGVARSGVYRAPGPTGEDDAAAMRRIDALYTEHPFYGSRRIAFALKMNRKRVQRLMRLMDIEALGPKPRTSKPAPGHRIYPYLLRNLTVDRPNQVWASDTAQYGQKLVFRNSDLNLTLHNFINIDAPLATARSL